MRNCHDFNNCAWIHKILSRFSWVCPDFHEFAQIFWFLLRLKYRHSDFQNLCQICKKCARFLCIYVRSFVLDLLTFSCRINHVKVRSKEVTVTKGKCYGLIQYLFAEYSISLTQSMWCRPAPFHCCKLLSIPAHYLSIE